MPTAEHVVLVNCQSSDGVFTSEMAYYGSGTAGSSPSEYAQVTTATNETAAWACSTTTAVFTDTETTFVAVIGPNVTDGAWAGTGSNGYDSNNGGFRCWQKSTVDLYVYETRTCSMIYDCDHDAAPCKSWCLLLFCIRLN